jgi:hypothetical protein
MRAATAKDNRRRPFVAADFRITTTNLYAASRSLVFIASHIEKKDARRNGTVGILIVTLRVAMDYDSITSP